MRSTWWVAALALVLTVSGAPIGSAEPSALAIVHKDIPDRIIFQLDGAPLTAVRLQPPPGVQFASPAVQAPALPWVLCEFNALRLLFCAPSAVDSFSAVIKTRGGTGVEGGWKLCAYTSVGPCQQAPIKPVLETSSDPADLRLETHILGTYEARVEQALTQSLVHVRQVVHGPVQLSSEDLQAVVAVYNQKFQGYYDTRALGGVLSIKSQSPFARGETRVAPLLGGGPETAYLDSPTSAVTLPPVALSSAPLPSLPVEHALLPIGTTGTAVAALPADYVWSNPGSFEIRVELSKPATLASQRPLILTVVPPAGDSDADRFTNLEEVRGHSLPLAAWSTPFTDDDCDKVINALDTSPWLDDVGLVMDAWDADDTPANRGKLGVMAAKLGPAETAYHQSRLTGPFEPCR